MDFLLLVASLAVASPGFVAAPSCTDLAALERVAQLGQLGDEYTACLEARLDLASKLTEQRQVSRLLLLNAEGGDEWGRLAARHLESLDRSDPDLCLRYARYLLDLGPQNAEQAIYWSDKALSNRHRWNGDEYVVRVTSLFALRAEASHRLWEQAAGLYRKAPTPGFADLTKHHRDRTKEFAREWHDFATAADVDSAQADSLCEIASDNPGYCDS